MRETRDRHIGIPRQDAVHSTGNNMVEAALSCRVLLDVMQELTIDLPTVIQIERLELLGSDALRLKRLRSQLPLTVRLCPN